MEHLDLFTPIEEGLPQETGACIVVITRNSEQFISLSAYSSIGKFFGHKNVTHWLDLSKLTSKKAKKLPDSEDVKRWFQLLVGKSEEEMKKDIENTLL